ncbi:hypothetical protein [Paenibacillus tepidiphilus]|uniref:hypothetical protein n=1 Tax=Paenibacillus tepidiphilus TaxID=2608683 RepID=UPI001239E8F6|nr:hypothetical protein [Paenibacillus tepidiphilus]
MKDQTSGHALYFVIGFLCVSLVITLILPVVRTLLNDVVSKKPTIPTSMIVEPVKYEERLTITMPGQTA